MFDIIIWKVINYHYFSMLDIWSRKSS